MKKLIYSQEDLDLILSLETQEKDEEIKRLNNIISKIEKYIKENSYIDNWDDRIILTNYLLEYIQELKGSDKE